jgi:Domain of unknown function (DUF4105)
MHGHSLLCAALVLSLALLSRPVLAGERSSLSDAVARAHAMRLASDPEWLLLLHYNTGFFGGTSSEAERGSFFLSPRGRDDHEAELVATLNAFFDPVIPGHEDEHALCRFPARREWLDRELHFLGGKTVRCPELETELAKLDPTGVALVYASSFVGNPASAFGHTFLHLWTRRGAAAPQGTDERDAADRGIEYRVTTDTKNPILYAFKGIAGLFPGHLETLPYDKQARRYTTDQARDLWEYSLALTDDELHFLLLHIWELRLATIDYYYLTRNCSFEVIALLETAAPRLALLKNLKALVLPIDTVKVVAAVPGLVRAVAYRPSLETRLHARFDTLTTSDQWFLRRLLRDPTTAWPAAMAEDRRRRVLDAAIFELEAHASTDLEKPTPTKARSTWEALVQRQEGATLPEPLLQPDWDVRPELAHGTMRFMLGSGVTSQYGDNFGAIGFRLALHDLTDPPDGSPELSQLVILDAKLRYTWRQRQLTVDTMTFADLMSLNPIAPAEPLVSFRLRAFGMRLHDRDCPDCFAHGLEGAVGTTLATRYDRVAFFVMADAYFAFLPHLTGLDGSFVRLGVGPYGGLRVRVGETVGLLTGSLSYLPGEKLAATFDTRLTIKQALTKDVALGLELAAQPLSVEGQLASYVYF